MKHLLIPLISILLLSSPVIGDNHKGETLYGWGNTLPYVWKGFGDKETHSVYKGDVENGVPNGLGFITFPDGSKYVGEWNNGGMTGKGTQFFPKMGRKFVGEFKNGLMWNGSIYYKDGTILQKIVNGKVTETYVYGEKQ